MLINLRLSSFLVIITVAVCISGISIHAAAAKQNPKSSNPSRRPIPQTEPPKILTNLGVPFDFRLSPEFQETGFSSREWNRVQKLETQNPVFDHEVLHTDDAELAAEWKRLYSELSYATRETQIRYVNRLFNLWHYREDSTAYRRDDYWASPREFITYSGDCEDYAIIKYFALRTLGVPARDLCIVGLKTPEHAILVVQDYDGFYVLDNNSDAIVARNNALNMYVPAFYINENGIWKHQ